MFSVYKKNCAAFHKKYTSLETTSEIETSIYQTPKVHTELQTETELIYIFFLYPRKPLVLFSRTKPSTQNL